MRCGRGSAAGEADRSAVAEALAVATVVFIPLHLIEPYFVTTGMPHLWWALLGLALAEPVSRRATGTPARPRARTAPPS